MFPKLEKSGFSMQLKPIKFNSFKNSLSYINKRDYFLKSSILPPPQSNEVRNVNKNPSKIMNLIRQSKIHMDCINDLRGLNSNNKNSNKELKNGIMLPFGPIVPLHNNFSMDKHLNNENSDSSYYNIFKITQTNVTSEYLETDSSSNPKEGLKNFINKLYEI